MLCREQFAVFSLKIIIDNNDIEISSDIYNFFGVCYNIGGL